MVTVVVSDVSLQVWRRRRVRGLVVRRMRRMVGTDWRTLGDLEVVLSRIQERLLVDVAVMRINRFLVLCVLNVVWLKGLALS